MFRHVRLPFGNQFPRPGGRGYILGPGRVQRGWGRSGKRKMAKEKLSELANKMRRESKVVPISEMPEATKQLLNSPKFDLNANGVLEKMEPVTASLAVPPLPINLAVATTTTTTTAATNTQQLTTNNIQHQPTTTNSKQ